MELFEKAVRAKMRFPSVVGWLTTEDLFDLPLTARAANRPDLDAVAKEINTALKACAEESFVSTAPNPRKAELEVALDVVKHVIAVKMEARAAAETAAANAERKRKLLGVLASKQDDELKNMTKEQIEEELNKLDVAA